MEEFDSISGGSDRDWPKDGCVAACERFSWCGSNDQCFIWDATYDNLWATCPDEHEHVFDGNHCVRCGTSSDHPLFNLNANETASLSYRLNIEDRFIYVDKESGKDFR